MTAATEDPFHSEDQRDWQPLAEDDGPAQAHGGSEPLLDGPGEDNDAGVTPVEFAALYDQFDWEPTSTLALFEGDEGSLDVSQRRALVVLIKQRFISNRTHPKEWRALTAKPRLVRARLNDLFLELVLDLDRQVAYKRQVSSEGGGRPFPTLLYDAPWNREETLALVHLRTRYRNDQAVGADRSYVDRADVAEYVTQQRPGHATDVSGDAKRAAKAIENVYKAGLLMNPAVRAAISQIPDTGWRSISYPQAVWEQAEQRWVSDAQVAEIEFTAFTSRSRQTARAAANGSTLRQASAFGGGSGCEVRSDPVFEGDAHERAV